MNQPANPEVQQLLDQLHGVIPPEPVTRLPAIGWILAGGLLFLALLALLIYLFKRWRQGQYRRAALAELNHIADEDPTQYAMAVNQLLKRVAMTAYGREKIADMHGEPWRDLLQDTVNTDLDPAALGILAGGLYQPDPDIDRDSLKRTARVWIRDHRRPKRKGGMHRV